MKLYKHQKNFLSDNPDKALLRYEPGGGKTFVAKIWLENRLDLNPLVVVCFNAIKKDWEDDRWTTVTSHEFKNMDLTPYNCIIVDEFHKKMSSGLFVKGRSATGTTLYNFIREKPDIPILLLSATPITSSPNQAHNILCYMNQYTPYKQFKKKFFTMVKKPFAPYPIPEPIDGWRVLCRDLITPLAYDARLSDIIDVPEQKHIEVRYKTNVTYPELMGTERFVAEHKGEILHKKSQQQILDIIEKYQKVVLVLHYRDHIDFYREFLSKYRDIFVLDGRTPDQNSIIKEAQASEDCIFIIQASLGSGFDADTFACMILASTSYSFADYKQVTGRILRIHNPHSNHYYHLLPGARSRAVWRRLQKGKDFTLYE